MPPSLRATVLYAGIAIRQRMVAEEQSPDDVLAYLRQGEAYYQSLDYASAKDMAAEFGWDVFSPVPRETVAFRQTIDTWVRRAQPAWVGIVPLGRAKALETLDENMQQCLSIGGLLGNTPESLRWWDSLASWARRDLADKFAALGRAAEERCVDRERGILAGTGREPMWVAIEDNTAGYDVRSWRQGDIAEGRESWRRHYIEVKSSVGGEAIHLPRSEWEFAMNHPADWELQVWVGVATEPVVADLAMVRAHVPADLGDGRWESIKVPCAALGYLADNGDTDATVTAPLPTTATAETN